MGSQTPNSPLRTQTHMHKRNEPEAALFLVNKTFDVAVEKLTSKSGPRATPTCGKGKKESRWGTILSPTLLSRRATKRES